MNFSEYIRKFLEYERLPVIRRSAFEEIGRYSESQVDLRFNLSLSYLKKL